MLKRVILICLLSFSLSFEAFTQKKDQIFYFEKGSKVELIRDLEKNEYFLVYPAKVHKVTYKIDAKFFTELEETLVSLHQMRRPHLRLALNITLLEKYLEGKEEVPYSKILFIHYSKPQIRMLR